MTQIETDLRETFELAKRLRFEPTFPFTATNVQDAIQQAYLLSLSLAGSISPQGRLTLTSGTPVMGSGVAAATSVYYSPYVGNSVPLYDGANMAPTAFTELSQATTDATKSPAAVAASKIYDLFVWNDTGTIRCTRGPAWTNATTRGYTLTMVNSILLNTSIITNGPAALRGTYVGTIASNAGSTIDFIFGTTGSGGVAGAFNVWNAYNRVDVGCVVVDNSASYAYASATIRQAHASSGMQVSFVVGLSEDAAFSNYIDFVLLAAVTNASATLGLGYDSVTTASSRAISYSQAASGLVGSPSATGIWNPGIGSHYVAALEGGDGAGNANTFNFAGGGSVDGLSFRLRM